MEDTRMTTREAAALLGCNSADAIALMRAARVPCTREGCWLWSAKDVRALNDVLHKRQSDGEEVGNA